jgi:hypothetical protein
MTLLKLWQHTRPAAAANSGIGRGRRRQHEKSKRRTGERQGTQAEAHQVEGEVGEDGDDGGARRRSSACTAAHQVCLGGGGDVLEQLRLRFSEEEEDATAAPSPRSDGDAEVWFVGSVLVFSNEFLVALGSSSGWVLGGTEEAAACLVERGARVLLWFNFQERGEG